MVNEVGDGTPGPWASRPPPDLTYDDLGDVIRQARLGRGRRPERRRRRRLRVLRGYRSNVNLSASGIGAVRRRSPHDPAVTDLERRPLPDVGQPAGGDHRLQRQRAGEVVYRHRDGRGSICDNASVTHLEESIDGRSPRPRHADLRRGAATTASSTPSARTAGATRCSTSGTSTATPTSPTSPSTTSDRSAVDHFLGGTAWCRAPTPTPKGCTRRPLFDPLTNRVASRTDANGNTINYTYDALGRLASISSPVPTDPQPLVSFEYFVKPNDPHVRWPATTMPSIPTTPSTRQPSPTASAGSSRPSSDATLFNGGGQPATRRRDRQRGDLLRRPRPALPAVQPDARHEAPRHVRNQFTAA